MKDSANIRTLLFSGFTLYTSMLGTNTVLADGWRCEGEFCQDALLNKLEERLTGEDLEVKENYAAFYKCDVINSTGRPPFYGGKKDVFVAFQLRGLFKFERPSIGTDDFEANLVANNLRIAANYRLRGKGEREAIIGLTESEIRYSPASSEVASTGIADLASPTTRNRLFQNDISMTFSLPNTSGVSYEPDFLDGYFGSRTLANCVKNSAPSNTAWISSDLSLRVESNSQYMPETLPPFRNFAGIQITLSSDGLKKTLDQKVRESFRAGAFAVSQ